MTYVSISVRQGGDWIVIEFRYPETCMLRAHSEKHQTNICISGSDIQYQRTEMRTSRKATKILEYIHFYTSLVINHRNWSSHVIRKSNNNIFVVAKLRNIEGWLFSVFRTLVQQCLTNIPIVQNIMQWRVLNLAVITSYFCASVNYAHPYENRL